MCGIAGILRTDGAPVDGGLLRAMTGILAHRGPDGDGFYEVGPVGLGHRRLAIIDLTTGDQPMCSADGSLAIVFNGEIYNFRELREQLERRGHAFRTRSDTEVVLQAYEAFGVDCLRHLRGMFAFALWDGRQRRLMLARDRVGIKPLYYAWDGRRLLFASELKAILQDASVDREMDWAALGDYLALQYVPSPRTIFRTVRKLEPASLLLVEVDRGAVESRRYWDLTFRPDERRSGAEWVEGLHWHLVDAVRSHLVSDVPIGAFLSGGVDSSTVVALMAEAGARPLRTFSIGFDEADFDELRYARTVAQRYGTDHYEFVVKPDAVETASRLAWQFDEPFADASALPTYLVARLTREHVTVALSGDGGDENFAGYRRYAEALDLHRRLDGGLVSAVKPALRLAARLLPPGVRGQGSLELFGADPVERYFRAMTVHRERTLRPLLAGAARREVPIVTAEPFRRLMESGPPPDYVAAMQVADIRTYLPDDILTKVDRTSMLVSLEARVPLLDHVLMEWMATMPTGRKLAADGIGKAVLKEVMRPRLPADVLQRRKMGFGVPLPVWFRGRTGEFARDLLLDRRATARGVFDPVAVGRLLDEHAGARRDRSAQIWALMCFEQWARQWLDARDRSETNTTHTGRISR